MKGKKITIPLCYLVLGIFIIFMFLLCYYYILQFKQKHDFIINYGAEPISIDPHLIQDINGYYFIDNMFSGLLSFNTKTKNYEKDLVEGWSTSPDKTSYRFFLRDNIYWSDGVPITTEGIKESFIRILTKGTGATFANSLKMLITNGTEFYEGKVDKEQLGIKAIDDQILEINLVEPKPYFIDMLAHPTFYPVPMHIVNKHGEDWIKPENIVVSGPFKLKKKITNKQTVLEKNPYYHNNKNVTVNKLIFIIENNREKAFEMYENGNIDLLINLNPELIEKTKGRKDLYLHKANSTYFYSFNTQKEPLNNSKVREALILAVDREELVHSILKNKSIPTRKICPMFNNYKFNKALNLFDKGRAKKLLEEAGYPNGIGFPSFTIKYNNTDNHEIIAKFVQQEWLKNLGIHINIINEDLETLTKSKIELKHEVIRTGWTGDYDDASTFLNIFTTENEDLNGSGHSNPEYDKLIEAANKETDNNIRQNILREAESILIEKDFQVMPLFFKSYSYLFKNHKWTGWSPNSSIRYILNHIKPIKKI